MIHSRTLSTLVTLAVVLCAATTQSSAQVTVTKPVWDQVGFQHHDHDTGRPDARIEVRLVPVPAGGDPDVTGARLDLCVSALDAELSPPPGFEWLAGSNPITAEELRMLLHRQRLLTGANHAEFSPHSTVGRLDVTRFGTIPRRRLLDDGTIDYRAQSRTYFPLTVTLTTDLVGPGRHVTTWFVDDIPRLRITAELGRRSGRIVDLERLDPPAPTVGSLTSGLFSTFIRQDDGPPEKPFLLDLVDWEERDIEGRWVVLQPHLERATNTEGIGWVRFLASRGEFELLELAAIAQPRRMYTWGIDGILLEAGSDRWLRVAEWCLASADGHTMNAAQLSVLGRNPTRTLAWFERHPELQKRHAGLFKQLSENHIADPTVDAKPPLTAADAFPHLRRLGEVRRFGDRKKAKGGHTYLHQVRREIEGLSYVFARHLDYAPVLLDLVRHSDPAVRQLALLAYTRVPSKHIPREMVLAIADDPTAPANVREAALLAYSYVNEVAVPFRLLEVAADFEHPAWQAAVSRLADVGDRFVLRILDHAWLARVFQHSTRDHDFAQDELKRLEERLATAEQRARAENRPLGENDFRKWIDRVVVAESMNFEFRDAFRTWTIHRFLAQRQHPKLEHYLRRIAERGPEESREMARVILSALFVR